MHLSNNNIKKIKIPLPPIKAQKNIVETINKYQQIIEGAKKVVKNWQPIITIDSDWPIARLPDICDIKRGKFSYRPRNSPHLYNGEYPFIQTGDIVRADNGNIIYSQTLNEEGLKVSKLFKPTIVLITIAANIGNTAVLNYPACFPDSIVALIPNEKVDPYFLEFMMKSKKDYLDSLAPQMAQKNINIEILKKVTIPLPSLETQKKIVKLISEEKDIIQQNKELIKIFEKKIEEKINEVYE